jgi:hypothetical protein
VRLDINDILNILSLLLTSVSVLLAIYFYKKSKNYKSVICSIWSTSLLSPPLTLVPNLKFIFEEREIKDLTLSTVGIWNGSSSAIERKHIATNAPLSIEFDKEFEVLKVIKEYESNTGNNFQLTHHNSKYILTFDFFNPREGAIIKIIHTAPPNKKLKVSGYMIGGKISFEYTNRDYDKIFETKSLRIMKIVELSVIAILLIFLSIMNFIYQEDLSIQLLLPLIGSIWIYWLVRNISKELNFPNEIFLKRYRETFKTSQGQNV